jgi:hypothetical protein
MTSACALILYLTVALVFAACNNSNKSNHGLQSVLSVAALLYPSCFCKFSSKRHLMDYTALQRYLRLLLDHHIGYSEWMCLSAVKGTDCFNPQFKSSVCFIPLLGTLGAPVEVSDLRTRAKDPTRRRQSAPASYLIILFISLLNFITNVIMAALLQNQLGLNVRGNLINCWFVLDNTGSMAGSKWNLARYPYLTV